MNSDPKGLGAMFDAHCDAEFKTRDIEATMATMGAAPHVTHVPVMTGGNGHDAVRRFYQSWFIGHWPEDLEITQVARTVGEDRVVDEVILSFTHDCEMPAILPGIKPTGRKVTIPFVVVVGFKDGKVEFERIYWDQASVLRRSDSSTKPSCQSRAPNKRRGCSIRACRPTRSSLRANSSGSCCAACAGFASAPGAI
jgi:carboxymethylenebutenolidase